MKSCEEIRAEFMEECRQHLPYFKPRICIVQVGDNPASNAYARGKLNDCEQCGVIAELRLLPKNISHSELLNVVKGICNKQLYTGVIVQLPLPSHINADEIMNAIPSSKDIDGFVKDSPYTACTPKGVMLFFKENNIELEGKHCVIINRSRIVGKPLIDLLLEKNATVTVCHSHTTNLQEITKTADILITAVGKENFITQDMVKKEAIIIDVGITTNSKGKLCGDVAKDVECYYKTPVPKGVGLLTRTAFVMNCRDSVYKNREV